MRASCRAGSTTAHRSAKPSATASYAYSLAGHVLPALGARRLGDVRLRDVQALVDGMARARADASTIRNALMPLRVIFRRALARGDIAVNPVTGVVLPAVRGRRERFATPAEAAALISAVPERDRAVWATAFYAGLRRGELRGLRWEDLDFERGTIHVRRTWDRYARADVQPKSHAGRREVPFALVLQEYLLRHRAAFSGHERVFATSSGAPFDPGDLARRAGKAWAASGLEPIELHGARHTFASLMAEAGVPIEDLSEFLGHSTINLTVKTYRHLYPEARRRAAAALDAFLAAADTATRLRHLTEGA